MVEDGEAERVRNLRIVSAGHAGGPCPKRTVRLLYDAAMRDVCADPAGTLARYQPTWFFPTRNGGAIRAFAANEDHYGPT